MARGEQESSKKSDKDSRPNDGHIPCCRGIDTLGVELGHQKPHTNASGQRPPTEAHQRPEQRDRHTWLDLAVPQIGIALMPVEQGEERQTRA